MDYFLHILILVAIFTVLAVSLDLLVGQAGLVSLCHAAFYGIGAYFGVLLNQNLGWPPLLAVASAAAIAALLSLVLSLASLRVHDDYLALVTFGFQLIAFAIFNNWTSVTAGALGIAIPANVRLLGWFDATRRGFAALAIGVAALSVAMIGRIAMGPFGRVLRAIRENEVFPASLGKNTFSFKAKAFAASAAFASLAGSLYAFYSHYIDPSAFNSNQAILILSMVIIGGAGRPQGPLVGALLLVATPELLRFVGVPGNLSGNVREILYGMLLVAMMLLRPTGLLREHHLRR